MITRKASRTLCALGCALLFSLPSAAAEKLVEDLAGGTGFTTLWPGGRVSVVEEAGLSWAAIETDGQSHPTLAVNSAPYTPALDASGRFVKIWLKIDDIERLAGLELRLSSDRFASSYYVFNLPVFTDPDFNVLRAGEWTPLTFSFGSARVVGKPRRDAIDTVGLYLADRGGDAPVTVRFGGLALVDEPPEGVVSITFDDGYDDHFVAAQLMAKRGLRGTAYVIPDAVGQAGYMDMAQLVGLRDTYGWDVAAHHQDPFTEMSADRLENTILGMQRFLEENDFAPGALHLAYPLGKQNPARVRPLVRKHFATARVAGGGVETLPPADPHLLRVFNVLDSSTPEEVAEAATRARKNKEWLILMFHFLVEKPKIDTEYGLADFERLLDALVATGVPVAPLMQVWDRCGSFPAAASADMSCSFPQGVAAPQPSRD